MQRRSANPYSITKEGTVKLDLLLRAKSIVTLDSARPTATSVGVLHGRIVGFDEQLAGLEAVVELDYPTATVTPGLIDAHCHASWFGLTLASVDVSEARGLNEVYSLLEGEIARRGTDDTGWVHASGFNQSHHDGAFPDIDTLDRILGDRPLYMRHTSGHSSIVNTATLRLMGVFAPGFTDPTGGRVVRDGEGRPTGLIEEAAQQLVQSLILPYSTAQLVDALDNATRQFASQGITSYADAGVGGGWIGHSPIELTAYVEAQSQGRLHARAQLMPALDALRQLQGHVDDFQREGHGMGLDLGVRYGFGDDRVRFGHVKAFLDGSLLGATAAVTESFCSHPHVHNTGYLLDTPEAYRDRVHAAYRAGWPLALHAIGDAAIDLALDLIDEAQQRYGRLAAPCRIEHFGISRPDQLARAGALGIAVTPQAGFIGAVGDEMAANVGPDREAWLYRGRSVIDAGVILAGSSDLPVADNNLRRGMQCAVERVTQSGRSLGAAEAVSPVEALRSYTEWAAQAMGQLADKGTLEPGKLADFAVFSDSPLEAADITQIEVLATIVGGTLTHERTR